MLGFLFVRHNPYCVSGRARNLEDKITEKGTLQVVGDELAFQGMGQHVSLPLKGIRFMRNRWLGGAIEFRNRSNPDWVLTTRDTSILKDPAFHTDMSLSQMVARWRVYFHRLRWLFKASCLALLVVMLFSANARTWMTDRVVVYVPVNEEVAIGEHLFQIIHVNERTVDDPQLLANLKTISEEVLRGVPEADKRFNFQFHIVRDPSVNAYAMPGGHIVIHSGLITQAESAEELAGVLGHEVGHVVRRHALRQLVQVVGFWALVEAVFGHDESMKGRAEGMGEALASLEFSRDNESEADRMGWTFLRNAHIDPHGMLDFFERMSKGNPKSQLLTILSTHPAPSDRLQALRELETTSPKLQYHVIDVDFHAMKERMQKIEGAVKK